MAFFPFKNPQLSCLYSAAAAFERADDSPQESLCGLEMELGMQGVELLLLKNNQMDLNTAGALKCYGSVCYVE